MKARAKIKKFAELIKERSFIDEFSGVAAAASRSNDVALYRRAYAGLVFGIHKADPESFKDFS